MSTNQITGPIKFEIKIDDLDEEGRAKVWAYIGECIDSPETRNMATFCAALAKKGLEVEVREVDGIGIWTYRRLTEH